MEGWRHGQRIERLPIHNVCNPACIDRAQQNGEHWVQHITFAAETNATRVQSRQLPSRLQCWDGTIHNVAAQQRRVVVAYAFFVVYSYVNL